MKDVLFKLRYNLPKILLILLFYHYLFIFQVNNTKTRVTNWTHAALWGKTHSTCVSLQVLPSFFSVYFFPFFCFFGDFVETPQLLQLIFFKKFLNINLLFIYAYFLRSLNLLIANLIKLFLKKVQVSIPTLRKD